ncbi:MAG: protein kinase [Candidatus Berkiella sp.]
MEPIIQTIIDNIISEYTDNNEMAGGSDQPFIDEVNDHIKAITADTSIPIFDDRLDKIDDYLRDVYNTLCTTSHAQDLKTQLVHELIQAIANYITTENNKLSETSEDTEQPEEPEQNDFATAHEFFDKEENRNKFKLSKAQRLTTHSFIKMDDNLFELSKVIGNGAFGRVKLSETEEKNEEQLVVKIIQSQSENNDELQTEQKQIDNEVLALIKLGEFKAQAVREAENNKPKRFYIASKKYNGMNLLELLDNNDLTEQQRLDIAYQCCRQLNQAHQAGMLHLDVKPENIIVDLTANSINVNFIDWGTSEHFNEGNDTCTVVPKGTPGYMAPELLLGQASKASDVFSLGMMIAKDLKLPELAANLVQYEPKERSTLDQLLLAKSSTNQIAEKIATLSNNETLSQILCILNQVGTDQMSKLFDTMPEEEELLLPLYEKVTKMQQLMTRIKAIAISAQESLPGKLIDIKNIIDEYQRNAVDSFLIPAEQMNKIQSLVADNVNTHMHSCAKERSPTKDEKPPITNDFINRKLQSIRAKPSERLNPMRKIVDSLNAEIDKLKTELGCLSLQQTREQQNAVINQLKMELLNFKPRQDKRTILNGLYNELNAHREYGKQMLARVEQQELISRLEDEIYKSKRYIAKANS